MVGAVHLFVKPLAINMPRAEYEALPDRQDVDTLPVDGITYRDRAHPGLIFRCRSGADWSAYRYDAFAPRLTSQEEVR